MSKARLVLTALFVDRQTPAEVARRYGVHRSWVYRLRARYLLEGEAAFEPRSRRPASSPTAVPESTVDLIVRIRKELAQAGLDAGPETICWHLRQHHRIAVSRSTVARHLARRGLVVAEPAKRPRSSYVRFQADLPNECWQDDVTHYRLADGTDTEILSWLDDHSRFALSVTAHRRVTGPVVATTFADTAAQHGTPASTLTDNAMVYTTRYAGGRGGRNAFEAELRRLGVTQKNSRPNHPTTCGKVERFQQTLKNWLAAQPDQPATIDQLQTLLDTFRDAYNQHRPHRSLPQRTTPALAYQTRPKATPGERTTDTHHRIRRDRVDATGVVTVRHAGRLHHIGIGRTHARTHVLLLIHDLDIRVINATTGELLRELVLDPTRDYQPTGAPKGPTRKQQRPNPQP